MISVAVTGGRDYADRERVYTTLSLLDWEFEISAVIHGGAPGADQLAKAWAIENGVTHKPYPADWQRHGRAAGPIRNREMLRHSRPDLLVAFPGGRGTADCVRAAEELGIRVERVA